MTSGTTVTLFRPAGEEELNLIRDSGWRAFPSRLPGQPFFYPVLNESYATQIAREWNTRDGGTGYVLRFQVDSGFLSRYELRRVSFSYKTNAPEAACTLNSSSRRITRK